MTTEPERRTGGHPVPDAVDYLAGGWRVERELRDERAGLVGQFTGTAVFRRAEPPEAAEADGDWLQVEEGLLVWQDATREARRVLRLRPRADGAAQVAFEDGRFFHTLDLRGGHWQAEHPCGADRYRGDFTVLSADEWHLRWRVRGPSKDQLLRSVYRRQGT